MQIAGYLQKKELHIKNKEKSGSHFLYVEVYNVNTSKQKYNTGFHTGRGGSYDVITVTVRHTVYVIGI